MPIHRRAPEISADIANRLRQIDAFGQPQGSEAMEQARGFVYYGWVDEREWSLTPSGKMALDAFHNEKSDLIKAREARAEQVRMTAR